MKCYFSAIHNPTYLCPALLKSDPPYRKCEINLVEYLLNYLRDFLEGSQKITVLLLHLTRREMLEILRLVH